MSDTKFERLLEFAITVALLVFAGVMESASPGVTQVVIGAVLLRWFQKPVGEIVSKAVDKSKR